jgi:hypothetical protein
MNLFQGARRLDHITGAVSMSPSRDCLSWFADTVRLLSGNFAPGEALILEPSQENHHGSWNLVVDARSADPGHPAAGDVLTSLTGLSVPPSGGTDG